MNLKRQLLLVSLLTLVLPWAGCQFISETESALRAGQQQMLAGTARAIADSLSRYAEEFPVAADPDFVTGARLYAHPLSAAPTIDGYIDDWALDRGGLQSRRGPNGVRGYILGRHGESVYLYVEVEDDDVVYASSGAIAVDSGSDEVDLVSVSPPYLDETIVFAAEAPGPIVTYVRNAYGFAPQPKILAHWQDVPGGYHVEARIPASLLGTNLGIVISDVDSDRAIPVRSASYRSRLPGALATPSDEMNAIAAELVQPGMRLLVTDAAGWRLATAGSLSDGRRPAASVGSTWLRIAYDALVEEGQRAALAEPSLDGQETQGYIRRALEGNASVSWFRSVADGRAVVAVAQPVIVAGATVGAVVLQQGTDAILSLTNQGLARLINVTLIATVLVAVTLLGYATWLSRRIRRLSVAAEDALVQDRLRRSLPSAESGDEVGDLARSFSSVLQQLADYNDYLRSLASKLSHELRTPLAIVTSSLENLEHEPLNEASAGYAARAKDGADRLRRILTAMSEASRVEELMANAEPEEFDLRAALGTTIDAYRDVYPEREFIFASELDSAPVTGAPELLIQLLDKLVDNAVDFTAPGDAITISLAGDADELRLSVANPGPALPERMRGQLFDSMVSVRRQDDRHLGLGLYVARLIAEGHGGSIAAANTDDGVAFTVVLPTQKPATRRKG